MIPFVIYHKSVKKPGQNEISQPSLYYIVTHIYKQRVGVSTMYYINTVEPWLSESQLSERSVIQDEFFTYKKLHMHMWHQIILNPHGYTGPASNCAFEAVTEVYYFTNFSCARECQLLQQSKV